MTRAARRCGNCGDVRTIERRARDGFPDLCRRCVDRLGRTGTLPPVCGRRERECSVCAKVKKIVYMANEAHGDLCGACYVRLVNAGELPGKLCGGCGKHRYIHRRGRDGEPDLCGRCYRLPQGTCHVCRRDRPCNYAGTERAICIACQRRLTQRRCDQCGRVTTIERRVDEQLVCYSCWETRLNARAVCERCGQLARPAKSEHNRGLCEDCAQDPLGLPCSRCGHRGRNYERELCARCVLSDRLDVLIAAATPGRAEAMGGYLKALRAGASPRSVLRWLKTQKSAQWMGELLTGRLELSHESLDALGAEQSTRFLRAALVAHQALPERDDGEVKLAATIATEVDRLPMGPHRHCLQRYAAWQVSSGLLYRKRQGKTTRYSYRHAHAKVRAAAKFLRHLHDQDLTLEAATQLHLDTWIAAGGTAKRDLQPFLTWAHKERLVAQLNVPRPATENSSQLLDDGERLALITRLLDDQDLDLRDRVAGCLILLLAQPVTRICTLTDTDITDGHEGEVLLSLGRKPFPLPPKLGILIQRLRDESPGTASTARTDERWLFRGLRLDRPMYPERLRIRLTRLGIHGRTGRLSALRPLAQLPPQVLSDLLGYSITTAIGLAETYRAADSEYIAARQRTPPKAAR
jgi:hypothetical protein